MASRDAPTDLAEESRSGNGLKHNPELRNWPRDWSVVGGRNHLFSWFFRDTWIWLVSDISYYIRHQPWGTGIET